MSKVTMEEFSNGVVLKLEGQFVGGPETDDLSSALDELRKNGKVNVILDFTDVKYLSSIVIGLLVKSNTEFIRGQGSIIYTGVNQTLEKVFRMLKLWQTLRVADSVDEAKKAFGA